MEPASNPLENITVVLVEPATPGNIGATARVLKNTGMGRLVLVNPGNWDTPETRWMAHGAHDILEACTLVPDLATALAQAHLVVGTTHRTGRFRQVSSQPRQLVPQWAQLAYHHRIALVFGREKDGLWHSELQLCHHLLRFPSAVDHPSFNLSQAVLLLTYEFFTALQTVHPFPQHPLANSAERERLFEHVGQAMEAIDFKPYNNQPTQFSRLMRRFFNRQPLDRRDVMVFHKICGQICKFAARKDRNS
ncbi:MAG: TrmJ/YjtD family RNA methyltransferase [Candidatus Latescibacteria bacterium]|nr:TrmJ/YjtD family RNA methyltransferase [Candidatus Latescibacterota bacterium]